MKWKGVPRIETDRLILRQMSAEDAPALLACFQDPATSRYWFTPDHSLEQVHARVVRLEDDWRKNGFGDWAIVDRATDKFIGFAGLHYIADMPEVNLGYLLAHSAWGRGLGTEACCAAIQFGFGAAGLKQIVGVTHPLNRASIRVLEKVGMTFWKNVDRGGIPRVVYSTRAQ